MPVTKVSTESSIRINQSGFLKTESQEVNSKSKSKGLRSALHPLNSGIKRKAGDAFFDEMPSSCMCGCHDNSRSRLGNLEFDEIRGEIVDWNIDLEKPTKNMQSKF